MAANGISTLATKELRQIAKLDLVATNRAADGNARPYYDLTQLPTLYDDNTVVDNENAGGLVVGRPWTSVAPTSYAFGTIPTSINEGSAGTFNVNTTGVANATTLYWTIETNAGDFATTSGSFTITSNAGSFTVTPTADVTTEGPEAFTVAVRTGSISGTIVATTASVTVNDTSLGIVSTGLVLHLDAGDTDSYPGTGTTWYDLSPSAKNATLGNSVYYIPADGGQLTFTGGSNGVATITSASAITGLTNNMTIEAWYNSDSVRLPRILSTGAGSDGICFGVFSSTITKWKVSKYGQVDLYVGSVPQDVNKWHQVVLVYSSTAGTKIYIDGVLSETNADTTVIQGSATPTITIGALESLYHKGGISIVRWYNTVLSDADILQNYNANIGRYKDPARVANILIYFDPSNRNTKTTNDFLRSLGELSFTASTVNATWAGTGSPYLTYNGTNAYASLADGSGYEPGSNNFSIEVWVYWDATTGASRCVVSKTDNGGLASNWSYGIRTSSAGEVYFEVGNGTTSIQTAGYAVNPGQWYQVVGVWTNIATNTMELYVNGAQQSTGSHAFASVKNSSNPLYLGTYNGGEYSQWFGGRIGVYRHYNIALSSAEVLQNYENDRGLYGI